MSDFWKLENQQSSQSDPILVYIHTEDRFMLNYMKKMGEFLNFYFRTIIGDHVTIELMLDGMLYIFKNRSAFNIVHEPISNQKIRRVKERLATPTKPTSNYMPLLTDIPGGEKIINCEFTNIDPEQIYPIMAHYYKSIHPEIELRLDFDRIYIRFPGPESLYHYMGVIYGDFEIQTLDPNVAPKQQN